jgi:prepilin-type N-terminal cleavage/methylation domain-containing protein
MSLTTLRRQRGGFTLIEVTLVVVLVGLLAGGFWWFYAKHKRKTHALDARKNIDAIFDASAAYYVADHADMSHKQLPKQFPPSTGDTPSVSPCCGQPGDRCDPAKFADAWNKETWRALNFSIKEPFYHWYRYESEGTGKGAKFTVRAFGDLDCDGTYSSFSRSGHIDENGNVVSDGPTEAQNEME